MELTITSVDYSPPELAGQTPIVVTLLREIPGDDRDDYWLGEVKRPLKWICENNEEIVTHLVLAARSEGSPIKPNAKDLPVGIAYVTDPSLLDDDRLDFRKSAYTAIGMAHETGSGQRVVENMNFDRH